MNILLISDLHIGDKARCPSLRNNYDNTEPQDYTFFLREFQRREQLKVDRIIFPGDLTNTSTPSEYRAFDAFFDRVTGIFGVEAKHCSFTLGNHDSDWNIQQNVPEGEDRKDYFDKRYDNLANSKAIEKMLEASTQSENDHRYHIWSDDDLLILAVNSGFSESQSDAIKSGHVDPLLLEEIEEQHSGILRTDRVRILLVHHHPHLYTNAVHQWRDYSAIQNAQRLIDFGYRHNFDLILHGHRHIPDFESLLSASGKQIATLCCGSFSVQMDHRLNRIASNQLHVVSLGERDGNTDVLCGKIRSWAFVESQGWLPNVPTDGIEHEISFGPNLHYSALKNMLEGELTGSSDNVVELKQIIARNDQLSHVRWPTIREATKDICNQKLWRLSGKEIEDTFVIKTARVAV